jgi:hypothetical protein
MLSSSLAFQPCPVGAIAADDFHARLVGVHAGFADGIRPMFPPPMVDPSTEAGFAALMERLALVFRTFLHKALETKGVHATLEALGYNEIERRQLTPHCTPAGLAQADALLRFDVLQSSEGLQVIELNAAAGIGGIGLIEAYDQAIAGSTFQRSLARDGWHASSQLPLDSVERLFRRLASELHAGPPAGGDMHVALAVQPRDLKYLQTTVCARYLARAGLKVSVATLDEIQVTKHSVSLRTQPVHVIWAVHSFEAEQVDPGLRACANTVRSAAAQGLVAYLAPPAASALGNKALLPLLLDESGQDLLEPADRFLVRQLIPETLLVTPEVIGRLVQQQQDLVLKPARGISGRGILFGNRVGPQAWRMALERILASGIAYVAQRMCQPQACEVPDSAGGTMRINVVLGGICVDRSYAGHWVRALNADSARPINVASGGTMAPCYALSRSADTRRI